MRWALAVLLIFAGAAGARAGTLEGPGRFCGYSPIIDLKAGERIITLDGGIHGGSFRWEGPFGVLEVAGIGWASRPRGSAVEWPTNKGLTRFRERERGGRYTVALWNRRHGAAYFSAPRPLTRQQLAAIDRVALFEEGEEPTGCKLRTLFVWE